jgi:hypothetical protein
MFGCEVLCLAGGRKALRVAPLAGATKVLIWRILTLFRADFTINRYSVSDAFVH